MRQLFKNNGFITIAAFILMMATLACTCTNSLPFGDEVDVTVVPASGTVSESADDADESTDTDEPTDAAEPTAESSDQNNNEADNEESNDSGNQTEAGGVTYATASNSDSGLSMDYPADWYIEEDFGFAIYSDEALVDSDDLNDGAGVFAFAGFPAEVSAIEAAEAFLINEEEDFTNVNIVQDATSMTINGNEAAQVIADSDLEGERVRIIITIINSGDNSATVLAISSTDTAADYADIFNYMIESVVLSEPVGFGTTDPEPTEEPGSTGGSLGGGGNAGVPGPALALDRVISGAAVSGAPASFSFQARSGREVVLMTVSPNGEDLTMTIFGPEGNELSYEDSSFDGVEFYTLEPTADGEYFIEIEPFSGRAEFVVGVIGLAADAPGMLLTDSGNTGNGEVEYSLTAGSNGAFLIYLEALDDEDVTLTLLDDSGTEVAYSDTGFSGEPEAILFTADGGDYTLVVDNFTSGNTDYDLYIAGAEVVGVPAGAGGNGGQAGGDGDIDGAAIASTDAYGDEYPVIDGATDFIEIGAGINYAVSGLSLAEVAEFYRYQASVLGLTERTITTIVSEDVINLVFDGGDEGSLVVQAVPLGDGVVNVNVRYEDI